MPKQSGIHQIKGKYGTTSYYGRKYSPTGFLRSINQEVSERVKTAENYAGTRQQNSIFSLSAGASWCVLNGLVNRSYYFLRPDFNGLLLKFFHNSYIKYLNDKYSESIQTRWRIWLCGYILNLQKYDNIAVQDFPVNAIVTSVLNPQTKVLDIDCEIHFDLDDEYRRPLFAKYDDDSLFEISVFSVNQYGKSVAQIQRFFSVTLGEVLSKEFDQRIHASYSDTQPRNSLQQNGDGLFYVLSFIPSIGGVRYVSKASLSMGVFSVN